jgi:hypothetical protein
VSIHYRELFSRTGEFAGRLYDLIGQRITITEPVIPFPVKLLWKKYTQLPDKTGLYSYCLPNGDCCYVGMGHVRARVWHHLGSPCNKSHSEAGEKEQGFPNHRWIGRSGTDEFGTGEMLVTAVAATPPECTRMLEGFAIWLLKTRTNNDCLNIAD